MSSEAQSELYGESPEHITDTCAGFKGDVCPIGKQCTFVVLCSKQKPYRALKIEMSFAGSYCPVGSSLPRPCDAGFYCNESGLHIPVGLCSPGFYCPTGSSDPNAVLCAPGHYCPRGTPLPLPCPQGTLRSK